MSWRSAMVASLLAALGRPRWWAIGLAGFLVRGGLLVLVIPIVSLPTPAGLANLVAPTLVGFVFGGPSPAFLALAGLVLAAAIAWLLGCGFIGAWLDLALVREVAGEDELEESRGPAGSGDTAFEPRHLAAWALAARLLAHVPTAAVLAWGLWRVVPAVYAELLSPGDPMIPVVLRVIARVPDVLVLLVGAWALGEAIGGLAVRRLAAGTGLTGALALAWLDLARRPTTLTTTLATDVLVLVVSLASAAVASVAWNGLRIEIDGGGTRSEVMLALVLFSAAWLAGAWLLSVAVTWRQVAWTFEALRARRG